MDYLYELENEVDVFMKKHILEDGRTLWEALVDSSCEFGGIGCDGSLLHIAEEFADKLLEELDDEQLAKIWLDTENGMMASQEPGFDPTLTPLNHDIILDVVQYAVESICAEANKRSPRKPKRKRRR